jgi:uncharacterized damage-inducible protein DinB
MDLLDRLLEHDRWATDQPLERCPGLTDAQLDQPIDIGHQTLRTTFEHMIFNVEAWTAVMTGQPVEAPSDDRSLSAQIDRHERSYPAFATRAPGA